ncbi:MAG TPA: hypothetical protein VGY53_10585, partial [Isosphaeraceae bacterium]|nr:hypothetical protein [Isosphaeraceae bacterium]
ITDQGLWNWVYAFTGIRIARQPVCKTHNAPFEAFRTWHFERPSLALLLGPRGGGKSFLSALDTHLKSRWNPGYATRVLGGSRAQSQQVYQGLRKAIWDGRGPLGADHDTIRRLLRQSALYRNGSEIELLACSSTSVRGPHVPGLKLDEVDEIDPELREAAMGMNVADSKRGHRAQALLTSTWHKLGGPMSQLLEAGRSGKFPVHEFCIFEVLERCPTERSGSNLEKCPACLIQKWCHADIHDHNGIPKAKRSSGHYEIDALCQKVISTSPRVFEADYLCTGPRADGLWFQSFTKARHVTPDAEYDPRLPVHLAVDSGVFTAAVWFQVVELPHGHGQARTQVRVFADFLSENRPAFQVACEILELARQRCNGNMHYCSTDPAGGARNPVGPTVLGEYQRAGLCLERWPGGSVLDGLALVESLVESADGNAGLFVHPRCGQLINAFAHYSRAKRAGQWLDHPADPQHPHEDLIDALRGGLRRHFPQGNRPEAQYHSSTPKRNLVG